MRITRSKIFLFLCLSFTAGVLAAPIVPKIIAAVMAVIFVSVVAIFWESRLAKVIGFCGIVLVLGVVRFQTDIEKNNLKQFYDRKLTVNGVIIEEPDVRDDKIYLTLGRLVINGDPVSDKILVAFYPNRNFSYGDKLKISGKVQEPAVFEDFNYKNYLSRFGIDAVMYYPDFEIVSSGEGSRIKSILLSAKAKFLENLDNVLPEPQNALLGGILVGSRRNIPQDLKDKFNATGVSHIVAISGFNITVIVWALELALRRYGKKLSSAASILFIVGFVILTGAAASAIRAAIIGGLGLIALNIGRLKHMTNALALSAAAMVFWNPKILPYDVGFQLSFAALCGLVYLVPLFTFRPKFLPEWIVAGFWVSICAQIFTLPILLYNFGRLSIISPVTNVMILSVIPPTMAIGFVVGSLGFVWPALAAAASWVVWILLSYIIQIVVWTSNIPYASVSIRFGFWSILIYYVFLLLGLIFVTRRRTKALQKSPAEVHIQA